jgi:7-cyano-7-deazaguanine synthase in queuosine biosynthesis
MTKTNNCENAHSKIAEHITVIKGASTVHTPPEMQSRVIAERARKATSNAAMDALKNGRAITIQKGNAIIKKYPDGREEHIKSLDNAFVVPKKRLYKI